MIKLLVSMAGDNFSYSAGEEVSLDKDYEQRLIDSGQAEPVKATGKKKPAAKAK